MKNISLSVKKLNIYEEVAQTSEYIGAKSDNEQDYERVSATDEDRSLFESYWSEACGLAVNMLKPFISEISGTTNGSGMNLDEDFKVSLTMPENFDEDLVDSINGSLYNYFSAYVKSKWFEIVNPGSVEMYANTARAFLDDVKEKMYYRNKPTRKPIRK